MGPVTGFCNRRRCSKRLDLQHSLLELFSYLGSFICSLGVLGKEERESLLPASSNMYLLYYKAENVLGDLA